MIYGIGLDLVELARMEKYWEQDRFIQRVLTPNEQQLYKQLRSKTRKLEFLGGRYACKEAYVKALGTGLGPIGFQELEILMKESGAPYFTKQPRSDLQVFVSLSHTATLVGAQVLLVTQELS